MHKRVVYDLYIYMITFNYIYIYLFDYLNIYIFLIDTYYPVYILYLRMFLTIII